MKLRFMRLVVTLANKVLLPSERLCPLHNFEPCVGERCAFWDAVDLGGYTKHKLRTGCFEVVRNHVILHNATIL